MAFGDPGQSGASGFSRKRKRRKPRPHPVPAPQGDVQSSGGDYGLHKAHKHEKTKAYRKAVRETYKAQPQKRRSQIARASKKRPGPAARALRHEHESRMARNRELEKGYFSHGDTKGDKDRRRAAKFLYQHPEILHPKHKQKSSDIFLADRKQLKAAGFKPEKEGLVTAPLRVPITALKVGQYTIETAVENPKQIPRLAKDTGEAALSIPAALIRTGLHPKQAVEDIAKDYGRRYGGIYNNKKGSKKEFKERQKKEGILPEVLDLSAVAGSAGLTAGRSLQTVARAGSLGKKAERIAAAERPRLQVAGVAKEQRKSNNFIKNAALHGVDKRRAGVQAKKIERAEAHDRTVPVEVAEAQRLTAKGIPTVAPLHHGVAKRKQRVSVATHKGKAIIRQKVEQGVADHAAFHALRGVDAHAFKYATQYGIRSSAQAKDVLTELKAHIEKSRKNHKKAIPKRQDEIPHIDKLLKNPGVFDDPKLHRAVEDMAALSRKTAEQSPGFTEAEAAVRRVAPQAELHGITREKGETAAEFRARKRKLTKQVQQANRSVLRAKIPEAEARGKAGALVPQKDRVILRKQDEYVKAAKAYNTAAKELTAAQKDYGNAARYSGEMRGTKGATEYSDAELKDRVERVQVARAHAAAAKAHLEHVREQVYAKGEVEAGKAARGEKHDRRLAALGRAPKGALSNLEKRRARLQQVENRRDTLKAQLEGASQRSAEPVEAFLSRVANSTKDLRPGEYYPSAKRLDSPFLYRTTGGSSAQADVKAYSGALTRTGREAASTEVFLNGIHKEIRRKHNWNLVTKVFEDHTLPWSRDKSLSDLQDEVDARNIDPGSVAYVNMRKIQQARKIETVGAGNAHNASAFGTADSEIEKLLNDAFINPSHVSTHLEDFHKTGWAIVPAEVANELKSGFKQASTAGRLWRVSKGKTSRILLSNPVWLQFQIASNAMMAGAHRTGLISILKAHYKFRQPEWKALESDIGVHKFYDDQAKMGAAATNSRFVEGWRAWQKVGAGKRLAFAVHPVKTFFDLFHRADTAQNNLFRRAVLYNDVKRTAYHQMAADAGRISATTERVMNALRFKDPERTMQSIINDPKQFEHHAQAVDDFLGNWTKFTSRERALLGNAMFGGFLRFSLRLAFHTMPMRHPIMASIVTQLGRLERDELERIFGTDVPPWEIGNYYSKDGKAKFDALRLNPAANALTQLGTKGLTATTLGTLSPLISMVLDQMSNGNVGFGQPWTINGKQLRLGDHVATGDRLKVLAATFLKLSPYYRDVEKYGIPGVAKPLRGKQDATSSLVTPEPRTYKRSDAIQRNKALVQEQNQSNPLAVLTPVAQKGRPDILKARDYAAYTKKGGSKKRPKKRGVTNILSGTEAGGGKKFNILEGATGSGSGSLNILK